MSTEADSPIPVAQSNDELTFTALRAGGTKVRIDAPDGTTYATFTVYAAEIDHIIAMPTVHESVPPEVTELAFAATYETRAEVRIISNSTMLLDDNIEIMPPPGGVVLGGSSFPYFFTFDQAVLGESTISLTSGGKTFTAPFVHLETADTINRIVPPYPQVVTCFSAMNGTRFVQGLTWTYVLEGNHVDSAHSNCLEVDAADDIDATGGVGVDVSAGGATNHFAISLH
ncbi:MAG TPA: hypothetical protein VMZ53_34310 [Kofleriaceae bacterium]|nr:hypothetical protein [Kofleriaceae bacterium]